MDIDTLAREVVDCFVRADFAGPPLPPYFARWAEREQARAIAAYGADAGKPPGDMPEFDSFTEQRQWHLGDLEAHLYRVEPTATALLLVLRGEALAYVAVAGQWFMMRLDRHERDEVPPNDLAMMCIWHRVEGELDMMLGGIVAVRDEPVHVGFQLEPSRYAALDDVQRDELHQACMPIARDAALLFCGRSGPLVITLQSPDPRELGRHDAEPAPEMIVSFDVP
jgi:hypothetical protein